MINEFKLHIELNVKQFFGQVKTIRTIMLNIYLILKYLICILRVFFKLCYQVNI